MAVDYNKFVDWAQSRFSAVDLHGNEVCVNSIYTDDQKKKLWCNPSGGKNRVRFGVFHCWKTNKKGTLVSLVMEVDRCSKNKALETLGIQFDSKLPIDDIDFDIVFEEENFELDFEKEQKELSLPPFCHKINVAPQHWYENANRFLNARKIPSDDFYICTQGKYEGRIIIPYYNSKNKLVYFNGRTIMGHQLRYKGPEKEIGVGKSDVIYFPKFPPPGRTVYLCEGEFDAYALNLCGFEAAACGGKYISEKQSVILSPYKVVLAMDSDEAGQQSMPAIYNKILQYNINDDLDFVSPPKVYKDWNEFLIKHDSAIVAAYISMHKKRYIS